METPNSHSYITNSLILNPFSKFAPYENLCSINYRLRLLNSQKSKWLLINLNNLYLIDYKINLFKNNFELKKCFDLVISQEAFSFNTFALNKIKDVILGKKYIIGLFDSFCMPNNSNYRKNHNMNTFLIYGFKNEKIVTYLNFGAPGSFTGFYSFDEIYNMVIHDLNKLDTKHKIELKILGFPISILSVKNINLKKDISKIYKNINDFYNDKSKNKNINIIKFFYENCFDIFSTFHYLGKDYDAIANLKIIKDFFSCQNKKMLEINLLDPIKNNKIIIQNLQYIVNRYAKYIYSLKTSHIIEMKNLLYKTIDLIEKNKIAIELGIF